ncbi:aromatase/cyclase [Streptomyces termitum]|uniref:aromatase/cyclase n=1 Tax=Streptomyces termitum TaxID=67368 RepID=UPI0033A68D31
MTPRRHTAEHTLDVAARPEVLYELVADAAAWPAVFGPTVHVRHLERGDRAERFRIWATVNGAVSDWTSRRTLDPEGLRVTFRQERSRAPIAAMGGEWRFEPRPGGGTRLVLLHDFAAEDDDPETVKWIRAALDRNSAAELDALARVAELGHPAREVILTFTDTLRFPGTVSDAYAFVHRADLWARRLPHVSRVRLTEEPPGVQDLEMDTVTADGSAHTTRSVRVCEEPSWIAYKQRITPRLLLGHSGLWEFAPGGDGTTVATARHTVLLDPSAVPEVLGAGRTLADARAHVRDALGRNSLATLRHAAAFAESESESGAGTSA